MRSVRLSFRLSVPFAIGSSVQRVAAGVPAGMRYRSIAAQPAQQQHVTAAPPAAANAGSAKFSAYVMLGS